jgi:hypothetical protein
LAFIFIYTFYLFFFNFFYAVEVGARGIPAKSLYNLLKDLGLTRGTIGSILERVSTAALLDSYRIWLGREGNAGSGGER